MAHDLAHPLDSNNHSGTLNDSQLSSNIPKKNTAETITEQWIFKNPGAAVIFTNTNTYSPGCFTLKPFYGGGVDFSVPAGSGGTLLIGASNYMTLPFGGKIGLNTRYYNSWNHIAYIHFPTEGDYVRFSYMGDAIAGWKFFQPLVADSSFNSVGEATFNTFIKSGSIASLPTADSSYRGKIIRVEGGTDVADAVYICIKNASNTYEWKEL